jgi:hypothetical protein
LKPDEFARLQPHEFYKLYDGWYWRQKNTEDTLAFFTAHIVNVQLAAKDQVTPDDLLKPLRAEENKKKKREDKKHLEEIIKQRKEELNHVNDIS